MGSSAFHDLPSSAFPLTVRAYGLHTGRLLWEATDVEPGAVDVPALAEIHGEPARMEIEFATGEILEP